MNRFSYRFWSVAAALFMLVLLGLTTRTLAKTPVILDTDIGGDIDDTWALVMLLKSPELDPKLITTTDGRAEYRAKLIAKMLTLAGRTGVAVGLGEGGRNGDGPQQDWVRDYKLSDYRGVVREDGVAAIIDLIMTSPEPITIISIGPSQTVAAALNRRPEIARKAFFVGMQGSVFHGYGGGAVSAEWNVAANVPAAKKVLSAPWKRATITPLDTCGRVTLSGPRFQQLVKSDDPLVHALLENYRMWAEEEADRRIDLQQRPLRYGGRVPRLFTTAAGENAGTLDFRNRPRFHEGRSPRREDVGCHGLERPGRLRRPAREGPAPQSGMMKRNALPINTARVDCSASATWPTP